MSPTEKRTTHFGYQEVPVDEKASRVADGHSTQWPPAMT